MSSARPAPRWHFLIAPRWLGWHAFVALSVVGMLWLGDWQFHRAEAGNALSWAYTFEWPVFSVFAVVFWVKTIIDEFRPAAAADDDEAGQLDLPAGRSSCPASSSSAAAAGRNSSMIVFTQNTTAKTEKTGHSNVYAQLSAFPASARWNCQSPSHSIPTTERATNACQPSHLGAIRKCHRGAGRALDMLRA